MIKKWKIAGINFDHMHMGDLLRNAFEHPDVEIAGICDENPEQMEISLRNFNIPRDRVFTDYRACLERTKPDLVILCPATAEHGLWTKRVAEFGVHIMVEKPFAASLAEADEMIAAQRGTGKLLAINWPTRWSACYITAKRLIDDGVIGDVLNVHHYGGNRGPLFHRADKVEQTPTAEEKAASWFYKQALGGGSLLDYAGYGATLGTWFQGGRKPIEVTCVTSSTAGQLEMNSCACTLLPPLDPPIACRPGRKCRPVVRDAAGDDNPPSPDGRPHRGSPGPTSVVDGAVDCGGNRRAW